MSTHSQRSVPRRTDPRVLAGIAIALSILGTIGWYAVDAHHETTDNAQIACDAAGVPAQVSGVVATIRFQDNQNVTAGTVLAELDPSKQEAAVAQAEAELASAKMAALAAEAEAAVAEANARAERRIAEVSVDVASADKVSRTQEVKQALAMIREAKVELRRARAALRRANRLYAGKAMSREALENAQARMARAKAQLAAAHARQAALRSSGSAAQSRVVENETRSELAAQLEDRIITQAQARRRVAEARVQAARAALEAAELNLSHTKIASPRDGIASNRSIAIGQMVGVGQPIVNIVSCGNLAWVEANFKETQLTRMRPGQPVTIEVDAYPGLELNGEVESIAGGTGATFSLLPPENATGNFTKVVQRVPVRIRLVDETPPDKPLRAGMSVVVSVEV